jgi:nitrogen fixation protein NifX
MRVAFTSTDGERVDEHFGQATHFHVWEVEADRAAFVGIVGAFGGQGRTHGHGPEHVDGLGAGASPDEDDRIASRANAIAGCTLVYTLQIGGPAAAKLVARRIHPMKTGTEIAVAAAVERLQAVLRGKPPPWLRKALGMAPEPVSPTENEDV